MSWERMVAELGFARIRRSAPPTAFFFRRRREGQVRLVLSAEDRPGTRHPGLISSFVGVVH